MFPSAQPLWRGKHHDSDVPQVVDVEAQARGAEGVHHLVPGGHQPHHRAWSLQQSLTDELGEVAKSLSVDRVIFSVVVVVVVAVVVVVVVVVVCACRASIGQMSTSEGSKKGQTLPRAYPTLGDVVEGNGEVCVVGHQGF